MPLLVFGQVEIYRLRGVISGKFFAFFRITNDTVH